MFDLNYLKDAIYLAVLITTIFLVVGKLAAIVIAAILRKGGYKRKH